MSCELTTSSTTVNKFQLCLLSSCSRYPTNKDVQILQKLLYSPAHFLTRQRLRELRTETFRLALMTKLATATCYDAALRLRVDVVVQRLGGGEALQGPVLTEVDSLLTKLLLLCEPGWGRMVERIDTSVLTAPPEQVREVSTF